MLTRIGATVVVMEHFDAEEALAAIERYGVTHGQWVPTMFVRLLKLPDEVRERYDVSTLRGAIHAAAPCPVPVKQAMIDWWGPIILEYYAATEGIGATLITSEEWLEHQGSVGKSLLGPVHIARRRRPGAAARRARPLFFEPPRLASRSSTTTTRPRRPRPGRPKGWATVGDVGYLDEDGYLYLTDRSSHMIISGGVNIYPQEAENLLVTHPKVVDCAVFGVPDDEMGEQVKAVVQPVDWDDVGPRPRAGAAGVLPGRPGPLQVPALHRLRARAAPPRDRQALQAPAPGSLLGRPREQDRLMQLRTITADVVDGVATLTLARPDAGNGIDRELATELNEVTTAWSVDPGVRAVLLRARARTSASAATSCRSRRGDDLPAHLTDMTTYFHAAMSRLTRLDAPVVCGRPGQRGGRRLRSGDGGRHRAGRCVEPVRARLHRHRPHARRGRARGRSPASSGCAGRSTSR